MDTLQISRRNLLARVPYVAAAAALPMAAQASTPHTEGDPDFAAKLAAFLRADEIWRQIENDIDQQIDDLPPEPKVPELLLEWFSCPEKESAVRPPEGGWRAPELAALAENREFFLAGDTWLWNEPADSPHRARAAAMLPIRREFDAARDAWDAALDAILETETPFLTERNQLATRVFRHPASTIKEVAHKIAIWRWMEGHLLAEDEMDDVHELIFADVLRLAGKVDA